MTWLLKAWLWVRSNPAVVWVVGIFAAIGAVYLKGRSDGEDDAHAEHVLATQEAETEARAELAARSEARAVADAKDEAELAAGRARISADVDEAIANPPATVDEARREAEKAWQRALDDD